jgi:Tfp pilus assembly protein PilF
MTQQQKAFYSAGRLALWVFCLGMVVSCAGPSHQRSQKIALAEATREIGEAYIRQGDYTAALRELIKAEKLNPEDHLVHNSIGWCYMAKKHMPEAIAHFKKAVALKPTYAPARNNLGSAYLSVQKWDAAIEVFKEITKDVLYATPHYPMANLGLAYYHKRDYREALKYYKEALKIQPDFVVALRGVGRTYLAMNQGRLALRYLESAVKKAPSAPEIHFDLAETYVLLGNIDQARASYFTVIDMAPQESVLAQDARQRLDQLQ